MAKKLGSGTPAAISKIEDPSMDNDANSKDREPDDWEIKDAVSTLQRGEELKKNPKMMKHVQKHIGKQMHSLADLKKLASVKAKEESDAAEPQ